MARQTGPLFFTGRVGDLSFYKNGNLYLVRRAAGPSRKMIMTLPQFEHTRHNLSEFGHCSAAGKALRRALCTLGPLPDPQLYRRLTRQLCLIKNQDLLSPRGQRRVTEGLKTRKGKSLLRHFAFYPKRPLRKVLPGAAKIAPDGTIRLGLKGLRFPKGASVIVLRALCLRANPDGSLYTTYRFSEVTLVHGEKQQMARLQPLQPTPVHDNGLYFLQLSCYTDDHQGLQALAGGTYDSLGYISAEPEKRRGKHKAKKTTYLKRPGK